jgi:phosphoribosylamine--glycine ligase
LDTAVAQWDERYAIGAVLAAGGYPASYDKGTIIHGLDAPQSDNIKVFHAGTALRDDQVVTSGGRVLCVTALAATIADAQRDCYEAADKISWEGITLRRDIGWRAIDRYTGAN